MSLEAITKIRDVEEGMDQARAQARAQAQRLLADAERAGRDLLEQGRLRAAEETAAEYRRHLETGMLACRLTERMREECGICFPG